MSEMLSNSKRKYIESWRQSVCEHMESGTICRITISEMTPEPSGYISYIKPSIEHVKAMTTRSPPPSTENLSPRQLPAVKFGYSHGNEELKKQNKEKNMKNHETSRTLLPPSPNGMLVQSGGPENVIYSDRRSNALKAIENKVGADPPLDDTDDFKEIKVYTRKSSQLAKEIFDKYNMNSRGHNMNGLNQFSMPWRNKTFLTLPIRFSESARRKHSRHIVREKTSLSSRKDVFSSSMQTSNESRYRSRDWEGELG